MIKKVLLWSIILCLTLAMVSCQTADILTGDQTPDKEWDLIVESGSNTTVNLYVTDTDEKMRAWLSSKYYNQLKTMYNIELSIKIMSLDDITTILEAELLNEVKDGVIDLVILKDEEFRIMHEKGLLYAEIGDKVLNFDDRLNKLLMDVKSEHGYALDGYGVPFGRQQMVLTFDEDELEIYPTSTEDLMSFVEDNPSSFTYPNPTMDEVGGEFIRTVIYEIVGSENMEVLFEEGVTKERVEEIIMPGLDYLKALDPYLLKDEAMYYESIDQVDQAFLNGDLFFTMNSDFSYITDAIKNEVYPDGARNFVFDQGTVMDTLYFAVPLNASNKTGAILAIHEMLSLDMQVDKYAPANWGSLPVIDTNLISEADAELFLKASLKRHAVRVEELADKRYHELPQSVIMMINDLWDMHVNQ
ncbi:ABC transporter substrate-binding protein [Acidaminobacter sp. JC074]|uniref:ABC transporter substrate-binding protein n=1 Tax=Acidaminobacter sp. JC074 TaxID=2530199 RepID=UPI001F115175|nr:ABC transporter substrate-binding protein [Acidaminobacter sp. JC074]MCH4888968.1 ABC transporter substrate-binding protein [Acidaminobacter sp. JC074]